MTFVILVLILGGLALFLSGVENVSITSYLQKWVGGSNATSK